MGGTQSSEQSQYGFHVLKVKENSPAYKAGIEQFFDYIVSINKIPLNNGDSQLLLNTLQEYEGKPLPLGIYSSKEQAFREVTLIPTKDWNSHDVNEKSLIGCSIRFCSFERAGENVWHVLDVSPNSPAEMAGIIPYTDYIIGSPHMTLRQEDDFYTLVEEYLGKPLRLYLYNSEWDSCRECIIVPNHEWGGSGSLGCDVGYGLLHRIPRKQRRKDSVEEPHQENQASYSDVIFSAPDSTENTNNEHNYVHESTSDHENGQDKHGGEHNNDEHTVQQQNRQDDYTVEEDSVLEEARHTALPESPATEKTSKLEENNDKQAVKNDVPKKHNRRKSAKTE